MPIPVSIGDKIVFSNIGRYRYQETHLQAYVIPVVICTIYYFLRAGHPRAILLC